MRAQTGESWNAAVVPKAFGALNLDAVSHGLPQLEHFVIFSSVVSSTGNEGAAHTQKPLMGRHLALHHAGPCNSHAKVGCCTRAFRCRLSCCHVVPLSLQARATMGMRTACATCLLHESARRGAAGAGHRMGPRGPCRLRRRDSKGLCAASLALLESCRFLWMLDWCKWGRANEV